MSDFFVFLFACVNGLSSSHAQVRTLNHRDAIQYVEEIVANNESLTEWQIKSLHRLILKGIDDGYAGRYRDQQVDIAGAEHVPPVPLLIREKMEELISWHDGEAKPLHPIERAAMLHIIFVGIHPFIDGSGRASRLLLNLDLMKAGYPPIIIKTENRLSFYDALDKAHTTDIYGDFIELVNSEVNHTLDWYLSLV